MGNARIDHDLLGNIDDKASGIPVNLQGSQEGLCISQWSEAADLAPKDQVFAVAIATAGVAVSLGSHHRQE